MEFSEEDRRTLERLESELWREETRFDIERMRALLAEDFCEIGKSGRCYNREETLAVPRQPIDAVFPLPNFAARWLTPEVAQVTYTSAIRTDGTIQRASRSSLWSRTPEGWVLRFHQGTPL